MSKVSNPKAPITTILEMKYTTIKITIEALDVEAQTNSLMLAGEIARFFKVFFKWGNPKMSYKIKILCPHCKQESPLELVDHNDLKCPKCGGNLKEAIEL